VRSAAVECSIDLVGVARHRLLAEHVLARLERLIDHSQCIVFGSEM
jgi:hypothetical protein